MLAETDIGDEAAPSSSFISPHKDFDMAIYPSETTREIAEVAYDSTEFLFDGSDQMPGEVGAGTFWKEMTAWISGDAGPRHRAEEHRRELASQLTADDTMTGAGDVEARQPPDPRRLVPQACSRPRARKV